MKKTTICLVTLVLVMALVSGALAVESSGEITPITALFSLSASEWFSDEAHRSLLTVMTAMELSNALDDPDVLDMLDRDRVSIVGKDGGTLVICGTYGSHMAVMSVTPADEKFSWTLLDWESSMSPDMLGLVFDGTLGDHCSDGYHENDPDYITRCIEVIIKQ